jgi:hypothetical protein
MSQWTQFKMMLRAVLGVNDICSIVERYMTRCMVSFDNNQQSIFYADKAAFYRASPSCSLEKLFAHYCRKLRRDHRNYRLKTLSNRPVDYTLTVKEAAEPGSVAIDEQSIDFVGDEQTISLAVTFRQRSGMPPGYIPVWERKKRKRNNSNDEGDESDEGDEGDYCTRPLGSAASRFIRY